MKQELRYIDLSWAVVAVCGKDGFTWQDLVRDGNPVDRVEQYVLGYMSFWHLAFIDRERLIPCYDEALREAARRKIDRYIAEHPPVHPLPRFYIVLLGQPFAPMEPDGMTCVYQM